MNTGILKILHSLQLNTCAEGCAEAQIYLPVYYIKEVAFVGSVGDIWKVSISLKESHQWPGNM